jgi:hypothetical protein
LTAVEVLAAPPPGEAVIAIPPGGEDSGRPRVFLRIGIDDASWIGSFEIGHMSVGTVSLMPGGKQLFVSAKGAGYIIDLESRTLVEKIGLHAAGVTVDASRMVMLIDHDGMRLEAFGTTGRLWKTDTISSGGFREISLEDNSIAGEARQASGWTRFSVELATGRCGSGRGLRSRRCDRESEDSTVVRLGDNPKAQLSSVEGSFPSSAILEDIKCNGPRFTTREQKRGRGSRQFRN